MNASLPSVSGILFHDSTILEKKRKKKREKECCITPCECPFPFLSLLYA